MANTGERRREADLARRPLPPERSRDRRARLPDLTEPQHPLPDASCLRRGDTPAIRASAATRGFGMTASTPWDQDATGLGEGAVAGLLQDLGRAQQRAPSGLGQASGVVV